MLNNISRVNLEFTFESNIMHSSGYMPVPKGATNKSFYLISHLVALLNFFLLFCSRLLTQDGLQAIVVFVISIHAYAYEKSEMEEVSMVALSGCIWLQAFVVTIETKYVFISSIVFFWDMLLTLIRKPHPNQHHYGSLNFL